MRPQGNTILITGGGSGIGRGLAEAFHALGNTVIITGRSQAKLDETAAANPGMASMRVDVADPADIRRFAAEVIDLHPGLNVLINNAGIMRPEDVIDPDLSDSEEMITTNLMGPIRMTAALLPHLRGQDDAAVLNVTSGLGFVPMAACPTYCATKAAMHSYTLSLREQFRGSGVEVIELIPPYVRTHLMGDAQANDDRAMPLGDYIADTMAILTREPGRTEVVIDRVAPVRHAESRGNLARCSSCWRRGGASTKRSATDRRKYTRSKSCRTRKERLS